MVARGIAETDRVLACLDANPIRHGHFHVIPKARLARPTYPISFPRKRAT